jgi:O-phosphoseryl-tRNA(Cys) synthetase
MLEQGKIRVIKELLALWKSGEMSSDDFVYAVEKVLSV